jgi:hypothetical protein
VSRPSNYFERQARDRKVAFIVMAAEELAKHSEVTVEQLAQTMEQVWGDAEWSMLAVAAGQKPPSPESRAEILTRLRCRADWRAA